MQLNLLLISFLLVLAGCNNSEKKEKNTGTTIAAQAEATKVQPSALDQSMERGKEVYQDLCMQCHLPTGKGVPGNFPPLAPSNWLTEKREASIHAVKYGLTGPIEVNGKPYNNIMAAQGLSDEEVADVLNYIMNSWGNQQDTMVTAKEVSEVSK